MADPVKTYTLAEVGQCKGNGDSPLWLIYRDSVYDVTSYVNEHPGGADKLKYCAGKDATKDFNLSFHSSDAKVVMAKYKIGEIIEEEKRYDANGKKRKRVVNANSGEETSRSCLSVVCCGLIG